MVADHSYAWAAQKCCLETLCYQWEPNIRLESFPDSRFVMIICKGIFQSVFKMHLAFLDLAHPSPLSVHLLFYLMVLILKFSSCPLKWKKKHLKRTFLDSECPPSAVSHSGQPNASENHTRKARRPQPTLTAASYTICIQRNTTSKYS